MKNPGSVLGPFALSVVAVMWLSSAAPARAQQPEEPSGRGLARALASQHRRKAEAHREWRDFFETRARNAERAGHGDLADRLRQSAALHESAATAHERAILIARRVREHFGSDRAETVATVLYDRIVCRFQEQAGGAPGSSERES